MCLAEAVLVMTSGQLAVGSLQGASEWIQLWVYRRERHFDLLVGSTATTNHPRPHRNIVSQGFETPQELVEALSSLDQIYKVRLQDVLNLPITLQYASPEGVDGLAKQLQQAGVYSKDSLERSAKVDLLQLEAQGLLDPPDSEEDLEVVSD
ncbi:hypothetical protein [Meiothermus granaticius]|uniref:Uncharacterized protein n=1 Tax=Meiothermus granaticius NBRC 107808 TaxID=1227551 RepID=A0A399F687_9DEIN|nr:hypothetical protein [Meiothermus granaticius]RIH91245.1 hypothetical protein Mgrana_02862 [Meiothermus granaticius NBRC 107808]GEM86524.1 hypothetical protein MGR01S_11490 [Meiothermus granaticius NBRC 107808]